MKANLFLVVSGKMDSNQKRNRNEHELVRLGKKAREYLGLVDETSVELWPDSKNVVDRINRSRLLKIHEAFAEDLKKLKESGATDEDIARAGFVTTKTFNSICREPKPEATNIWLSSSVDDTVVGGDPEFLLTYRDGFKYAGEINELGHHDQLGADGPSVEIRPTPSTSVDEVIQNINSILNEDANAKRIHNYGWVAGSYFYGRQVGSSASRIWTLGGHIHLGTPLKIVSAAKALNAESGLLNVFIMLKKVLDELIAVPMMRIEGVELSTKRRQNSMYGQVEDIRTEFDRLEYRTLSSDWLLHPELAAAVVGTTKALAHAFYKALIEEDMLKEIALTHRNDWYADKVNYKQYAVSNKFEATRSMSQLKEALGRGTTRYDNHFFSMLRRVLRGISTYADYKQYIDKFLAIVRLPEDVLRSQTNDLKEGWLNRANYLIH